MAQLTLTDLERAFQRQGWRYERSAQGYIGTNFDGVMLVIRPDDGGQAVQIGAGVYSPSSAERAAAERHARDVDVLISFINNKVFGASGDRFVYNRKSFAVVFVTVVPAPNGQLSDYALAKGIQNAVEWTEIVAPMLRDLIHGQLTIQRALDIIDDAIEQATGGRRRQSA